MDRPMVVLFLLGFLMLGLAHRADGQLVIGVYDQRAVGGQGASVDGLVRGLNRHGYKAEAFTSLQTLTLLQYDIVYLSDMHSPGNVGREWTQALKAFVSDGGSVLQTWHHHILGDVGVGIQRIYGSRRMHVQPGHAAVAGVADFDASFGDHIIERVGPAGTVILTNDAGQPVAV
ncbi:MAG: hypothetical protein FJ272_21990, partial [Planctomycetes bacterium]|nr:hypothetical protein [Planctomycetota bacterium]